MLSRTTGESGLISSFARAIEKAGIKPGGLVLGVGDDAAVIRGDGEDYVVTQDALVEHRHFRRQWFSGVALGWRAAAVNLSDVAAMGAEPRFALVSLVVPDTVDLDYVRGIERGIVQHCARYGAAVIGGNVSSTDGPLVVDLTLIGACATGTAWTRRARAGDAIVVAGALGNAAMGISALTENRDARGALVASYRKPTPLLGVAAALRGHKAVRAAIDVSDGFSTDVIHMCRTGNVGCDVHRRALPLTRALKSWCIMREMDPVEWVFHGGDDYALILSIASKDAEAVCELISRTGTRAVVVGRFTRKPGQYQVIDDSGAASPFGASGWDHFRKAGS